MRLRTRFLASSVLALVVAAGGILSLSRELERARASGLELREVGRGIEVTAVKAGASGLLVGDIVLETDGTTPTALEEQLRQRPEPHRLVVLREALPQAVVFHPAPVAPDWRYLFLALVGSLTLGIGLVTLRRAPRERGMFLFVGATLAAAGVLLYSPVEHRHYDLIGRWLFGLEDVARALLPPLLAHLALVAPAGRPRGRFAGALYVPALLLAVVEFDLFVLGGRVLRIPPEHLIPALDRFFYLHLTAGALFAVAVWGVRFRSARGEDSRRLRWLLTGVAGGFLPLALLWGFPFLFGSDWSFVRVLALPLLALVPLGLGAALVRFRLQDVDRMLARAAGAATTLFAALLVFGTVNLILERILPGVDAPPRHLVAFTAGFGSTVLLAPARRRIGDWVLRRWRHPGERERRALMDFARELAIHATPRALGEALGERIEATFPGALVNVYAVDVDGSLRPLRLGGSDAEGWENFTMSSRGRSVGLLAVRGPDGLPPDSEDRALLEALAGAAAVALDNARLYRELAGEADRIRNMAKFQDQVLESAGSGIAVVADDGRILAGNSLFASWVRRERGALSGAAIAEVFPPALPLENGQRSARWAPAEGERTRTYEIRVEAMAGMAGSKVIIATDTTDAETLRRELEARERLATVGLVAASVAHEVNTPLAGISSYAQMLLEETAADDPRHETLEKIEHQSFRAARIVQDVLEMARGQAIEHRAVDLRTVAESALGECRSRLATAGIELDLEFGATPATLAGDPARLERAVLNLLENAKDAAPAGRVRLAVGCDADGVWLTVADDGRGMNAEERARAFEPLYSSKGRAGTGLGLALAAEVVRAHGGRVALDSAPGRGTVVTLRFPPAKAEAA